MPEKYSWGYLDAFRLLSTVKNQNHMRLYQYAELLPPLPRRLLLVPIETVFITGASFGWAFSRRPQNRGESSTGGHILGFPSLCHSIQC